jgi:hypothetical protein
MSVSITVSASSDNKTDQSKEKFLTEKPLKLGKYKHYKSGDLYEVIGTAFHTETLEELVVYKALYHSEKFGDNCIWVRPKEMFLGSVEYNGVTSKRFQFIEPEHSIKPDEIS